MSGFEQGLPVDRQILGPRRRESHALSSHFEPFLLSTSKQRTTPLRPAGFLVNGGISGAACCCDILDIRPVQCNHDDFNRFSMPQILASTHVASMNSEMS